MDETESKPWRISNNEQGGESLWIGIGRDLSHLPVAFRSLLTDEEIRANADIQKYFRSLLRRCRKGGVKPWLRQLSACDGGVIEIATSQYSHETIFWVRSPTPDNPDNLDGVILRRNVEVGQLPLVLRELYGLIGGTVDLGYGLAGGVLPVSSLMDMNNSVWISERNEVDPRGCLMFYTTFGGDGLVARENTAYWYLHESGQLVEAGDLSAIVSQYFERKLDGVRLEYQY